METTKTKINNNQIENEKIVRQFNIIEKEYIDLSNMIKILFETISKKYKEANSIFQSK